MKIQILDREVELRNSFRSYIIFENITGKSFQSMDSLADVLCFMYATILGSLKTTDITWDDFIDYIDEHPEVVTDFSQWIVDSNTVINEASNKLLEEESVKKKSPKKIKS